MCERLSQGSPSVLEDEGKAGKDPNLAETRAQSPPSHFTEGKKTCLTAGDDLFAKNPVAGLLATVDPERLPSLNSGSFQGLILFSTETEPLLEGAHPRHLTWWEELSKYFPQHKYMSRS